MSIAFEQAAASYFGLPKAEDCSVQRDDFGLALHVRIGLSDADLIGITARMVELAAAAPLPAPVEDADGHHLYAPTLNEVMRNPHLYVCRPECAEVVERAAQLSGSVRTALAAYEASRASVGADDVLTNRTSPNLPDSCIRGNVSQKNDSTL